MISMEKTKIEFTATITTPDGKVITKKVVENIPSIDEYDPSDLYKFMLSFDEYERQTANDIVVATRQKHNVHIRRPTFAYQLVCIRSVSAFQHFSVSLVFSSSVFPHL